MNKFNYKTCIGEIWIAEENNKIVHVAFSEIDGIKNETPLIIETYKQLNEYFAGERTNFNVPLSLDGTLFQTKVWKELMKIPYGQIVSYKYIAEKIGNPNASRAVGLANNKNKIAIIVPCHRVIGSNKKLVGYAGGLDIKKYLINLEQKYKK